PQFSVKEKAVYPKSSAPPPPPFSTNAGVRTAENLCESRMNALKEEGRYRVFFDIERQRGAFPKAFNHSMMKDKAKGLPDEVTVWCNNDYLGMGQHPV